MEVSSNDFYRSSGKEYLVYSWGNERYGHLHRADEKVGNYNYTPKLIDITLFDSNLDFSTFQMLNYKTFFLFDHKGFLYSMGDGFYGGLGHGNNASLQKPKKIRALQNESIVQIAGSYQTLFLSRMGVVFGNIL